jgi:hypothetical protein
MDFGLSEEQQLLQETVRSFVENECPATRLREFFDGEDSYDESLWGGLVEMGVAGLAIPERYGGTGLEVLDLALVFEVLGGGAVPVPLLGHALAGLALAWGGSEAQREKWLPRLAAGEALATVAFAEPGERWQPEEWKAKVAGGRITSSWAQGGAGWPLSRAMPPARASYHRTVSTARVASIASTFATYPASCSRPAWRRRRACAMPRW